MIIKAEKLTGEDKAQLEAARAAFKAATDRIANRHGMENRQYGSWYQRYEFEGDYVVLRSESSLAR